MNKKSKKPLEWKMDIISTTTAAVTNGRIELGLRDDEIAEIHKIVSAITYQNIPDAANDVLYATKALSMDPDVNVSPYVMANNEDLEWFLHHPFHVQLEQGAAGVSTLKLSEIKDFDFAIPILVGTDIGQVVIGDAAIPVDFITRVYFTRRRANAQELNQILLKRR